MGFGFYGKVPGEATLSRYFNKLAESDSLELIFQNLIEKAYKLDIIDPENIAIDASKLNCYERAKPKTKIDKDNPNTPD